jgi:G:T-mismatch repair DNA endonuclease (very short patch repair protein)
MKNPKIILVFLVFIFLIDGCKLHIHFSPSVNVKKTNVNDSLNKIKKQDTIGEK